MRSIRVAFADASLCIDMEVWQQQFFRKVERLRVMKNKTFYSAFQGSPKGLPAHYGSFLNGFAWSSRWRATCKKGRGCNTSKWFTGPESVSL
ncbi:hypothetical protein DBL06_15285 [Agrobacterium pusense]|nr:hypothetical protein DBL06_15285 [Agrobacterium pusense]